MHLLGLCSYRMASIPGSYAWFKDVVGLRREGIVLRNSAPHICNGRQLVHTLEDSHASIHDCERIFGKLVQHNGFQYRYHKDQRLVDFINDLYAKVHQYELRKNGDIGRFFARGIVAQYFGKHVVKWAAFAVRVPHWARRDFVPHPHLAHSRMQVEGQGIGMEVDGQGVGMEVDVQGVGMEVTPRLVPSLL